MPLNLEPVQSRSGATTSYEDAFADELEGIYGRGIHDLAGVVSALNETGVRPPDGADWTEEAFTREIARLGAKEANR
ncbi:recombinase-like helix-turn-helix domain-containing protein [Saccharopolyspora griseoalba]|uniref:Recombinase-like helix-turn-helix domain-containing protein n=1 Tax=Saccharopolyspora griseoalba TaxID=1431848 RepID=A0ABW2LBG3_9PSEU